MNSHSGLFVVIGLLHLFIAVCAQAEAYSITVKPASGIVGTVSLNLHEAGEASLLAYERAENAPGTRIVENRLALTAVEIQALRALVDKSLAQYLCTSDAQAFPRYGQTLAINVTRNFVTQSVSTRRLSKTALELLAELNRHLPEQQAISLNKLE